MSPYKFPASRRKGSGAKKVKRVRWFTPLVVGQKALADQLAAFSDEGAFVKETIWCGLSSGQAPLFTIIACKTEYVLPDAESEPTEEPT